MNKPKFEKTESFVIFNKERGKYLTNDSADRPFFGELKEARTYDDLDCARGACEENDIVIKIEMVTADVLG